MKKDKFVMALEEIDKALQSGDINGLLAQAAGMIACNIVIIRWLVASIALLTAALVLSWFF